MVNLTSFSQPRMVSGAFFESLPSNGTTESPFPVKVSIRYKYACRASDHWQGGGGGGFHFW